MLALLVVCASASERNPWSRNGYSERGEAERYFWFAGAVFTAAEIAGQYDVKKHDCIRAWYYSDRAYAKRKFESVLESHNEKFPAAVVLMVLTEVCGPFGLSQSR